MPRDISSIRLSRLNRLMMLFHRYPRLSREDILEGVGYASGRTFERDAEFLRDEYGVEISYSRETRLYSLCSRGNLIAGFRKMSYYIHDDYDEFVIPYLGQQKIVSDPAAPQSARRTRESCPGSARIGAVPKVSAGIAQNKV